MTSISQLRRSLEQARAAMPKPPAERGLNSEEMIREVRAFQAAMAELDAAGLRWPREMPLDADEQTVYERILAEHGIPIRKEPATAEDLALIQEVERMQKTMVWSDERGCLVARQAVTS